MSKALKLNESVFELVTRHPEVVEIMVELGFRILRSLECCRLQDDS